MFQRSLLLPSWVFGGPILVAWAILDAIRDQERQRRAKVLTAVEELEKTNPDLYLIGQLIRDDIAISGRQSGLASLMQNTLFFVAGVALPWVLQSGVPVIHGWLNLK